MKKLLVLFAIAALVVMSLTACDFSGSLDVLKEDLNKLKDGFNGMVEDLEGAVDIDVVPCPNHADNNSDHNCDLCLNPATECKDESKDHKCDICNKALSNCEDANSDHKCDLCSATLSECDDRNNDHYCNVCGKHLSVCVDENNDHNCNICAKILSKCADENSDHSCDVCGKELSVCVDENDDNACDICSGTICEHVDVDKNHECDLCDKVISDHVDENNDHACDVCGKYMGPVVCEKHVDEDGDNSCDVCGILAFENVSYTLNISDLTAEKLTADLINGKFTIVSGTEIRNRTKTYDGVEYNKSVKIGDKVAMIKVSVPGTGKLTFLIQNGSSGAATQFITVTGPDGTVYDLEFDGTNTGSPVVKLEIDVTEGEWTISRGKNGGTQDVFYLALDCKVEISPECGFEIVTEGKTDYLVGESTDLSGLVANAIFENGKTDPIDPSDLVIDTSAVDMTKAGVYEIKVSYKEYDAITFTINVYEPASVELGFDAISTGTQSGAGNGIYFNNSFKESYKLGEDLDLTGLSATVVATLGDSSRKFLVESVEVTGFDSETAGAKVLKVNYEYIEGKSVYAEVTVYVTDAAYSIVDEVYQVKVEKSYDGAIGAIVDGYNMFTTVQQALDFLAGAEANAKKLLLIGEGLFEEKLEILIPNLTVKGAGADKTTIEWNSIYGQLDASGFSNVTDSTQTVAVREAARGCVIEDITISNYWNSQDRMDEAGLEIERGLALLVQADMFVMRDSKLLGIQDTLELFTGRQYFENVYISGYTDFIFGTNNTTYFKNCTVHVVDTVKDDKGTAGYLTAFKGSNKGAADAITYGAIFDGCKFTADEGVTAGKTAIGRTWGAYAAVAIINSELGGHISLDGYDSANNKNKRYISMNGIHPTDETVQFVEYNNTGAGAVTEAVAGMTMLTADEAAKYADFAEIFGTANRNVSYLDPWDPTSGEVAEDDRTYYYFNGTTGTSGTSYTYTDNIQGSVTEWEGLTIDATSGKLTARDSDSQFNAGAKIIFDVKAGTLVTVISYPGYGYYTINNVAHNANDTFSVYFAEDTEVVVEATATAYLYQIIINPDEEAPETPTISEIKVSGVNLNYTVGDELSLESVVVKAYYSDNSVVTVTDYTVDASAVNKDVAGSYDVVFGYGGKNVTLAVTYAAADALVDKNVTFGSNGNYKDSGIDFSGANMRDNGEDNSQMSSGSFSFDVKAGANVTVHGYSGYTSYTLGDGTTTTAEITDEYYTYIAAADVTITITAVNSNNYFYSISIVYPASDEPETPSNVVVDIGALEEGTTTGDELVAGSGVSASAGLTIEGNSKTYEELSFTKRLKLGGTMKVSDGVVTNGIKIVTEGKAKITIYAISGNSSEVRYIQIATTDGSAFTQLCDPVGLPGDAVSKVEFSVDAAGTYYVGSTKSGINIYYIEVSYGASEEETPYEHVWSDATCTAPATCECGETQGEALGHSYTGGVCSTCGAADPDYVPEPEEKTYTINFSDFEEFAKGTYADGQVQEYDDVFTFYHGVDSRVDANSKTFEDEFAGTKRFGFGGKFKKVDGAAGRALEINASGAGTVTIWWVSGGDGRSVDLLGSDFSAIATTGTETIAKDGLYITTFEIPAAGVYYLTNAVNNNYWFKVEVTIG